jgi:2-hydroxycyclohexanecarboxyl-CoA dehydrogenase
MKQMELRGKRVLVTGAASGIGREVAILAANDGARVAMLDINVAGLEETKSLMSSASEVEIVSVDLTKWESVEQAVEKARQSLGGFDAVCNVAGWASTPGRFWEQPMDAWEKMIDINIWSILYVTRAVTPTLVEQGSGRIVNVASDAGRVGSKGESVYASTKAFVIGLTKSLAREMAPYQVAVNCVCPGPTNTPLLRTNMATNPGLLEKMVKAVPMRRMAEPEDPALVVAFFASDAAAYVTGQIISVSGGLTMAG